MKKNIIKSLLSFVLAFVLCVGQTAYVFADETDSTGSSAVTDSVEESITESVSEDESESLSFEKVDDFEVSADLFNDDAVVEEVDEAEVIHADTDVVRVSIVLNGESTVEVAVEQGLTAYDAADNAQLISYRNSLKAEQNSMAQTISEQALGGETLDIVWNLTLAANIISANVKYGQIEAIENVPGVEKVVLETLYEPAVVDTDEVSDPNMATSQYQIGSSVAWAAGYTGAGSRIAIIDTGVDDDHQSFNGGAWEYSMSLNAAEKDESLDTYLSELGVLTAAEVASVADQLNVNIDANRTYLSGKIPYAYNYIDENYTINHDSDSQGEHGSHVTGIAAANAYVPDSDSETGYSYALDAVCVQGVAPDAQILTMKVFGSGGGAYDSDYMAAIEDAIVLKADAINLSLGSAAPGFSYDTTYYELLNGLVESGAVVSMSAGNSYYWTYYDYNVGYLYGDEVSFDTVGSPSSYTNAMSVASVDNDGATGAALGVNGQSIYYTETTGYTNDPIASIAGEYSYILIDPDSAGLENEYFTALKDVLEGKVAICSRGTTSFYQKAEYAVANGAVATVIYNNQSGTISMDLSSYTKSNPCVAITQADGLYIMGVSEQKSYNGYTYYEGTITINSSVSSTLYNSEYYTMSSFSSWGIPGSLELKPEITAPGGTIYSVNGAIAGGTSYETMSGTSMAAPQVAGMAAVLAQYIKEKGLDTKTGLSVRTIAQSLLMSTAVPLYEEASGGNYYSVLTQGAGLANVGAAVTSNSLIIMNSDATDSWADGKVKAELGDDPSGEGNYSFSFTLKNLTDSDLTYTLGDDFFTQDLFGYDGDEDGIEESYLDTWTTPLEVNTKYYVDGVEFIPSAPFNADVDKDGDTDADDAQAILNCLLGLVSKDDLDWNAADVDGENGVTTYDAYLILDSLETEEFTVAGNSSVTVKVDINVIDSLVDQYVNGMYLEGYVYVYPTSTLEGEITDSTHSIPVLGFVGSWTAPSMYDKVSYTGYLYGDETVPHMNVATTNNLIIRYSGDSSSYWQIGNPYFIEESYPEGRAAINSADTLYQYRISMIRNAAAATYVITNEDGEVLDIGSVNNQVNSGYYYSNASTWYSTYATLTINKKVSALGVSEGDVIKVSFVAIPEYYAENGTLTQDEFKNLVETGALGDGAYLTTTLTIDNTAPELVDVTKSLYTGNMTISAADNQYIAYVAVLNKTGSKVLAEGLPDQNEAGETVDITFDLSDVSVGSSCMVLLADYAGNEAVYSIDFGGESEDYSGRMFTFTSSTYRGSGNRWMEVFPETLYWYNYTDYEGTEIFAEPDITVRAAEYVDGYVYMAATDGYLYVAEQDDLGTVAKVGKYSDIAETIYDMAFNYSDGELYALGKNNVIYTVDLITGVLTEKYIVDVTNPGQTDSTYKELCVMTIDDKGNFYAINYGKNDAYTYLYTWSSEDITDRSVSVDPVNNTVDGYMSYYQRNYGGSLAWDHDKDIMYWLNCASSTGSLNNYLLIVDPETGKAEKANTDYAGTKSSSYASKMYATTYGLYIVPSGNSYVSPSEEATGIEISETSLNLLKGSEATLTAEVYPWTLTDKTVTWSSDNEAVVTVEDGHVTAVGDGTATITVTANASPNPSATCTVTVEKVPEINLSGLVYDAESKTYFSDFSSEDPAGFTRVSSSMGAYIGGTLVNDIIYVHDGSNMYGIDADTFDVTSYGSIASSWIWSDAAAAPADENGIFGDNVLGLCYNGTYLELVDVPAGSLAYWSLTSYFSSDPMAVIAYAGSGTYDYSSYKNCPACFYYMMTESGELYQFVVFTYTSGSSYTLSRADLGNTGLDLSNVSSVTGGAYASMEYDEENGYLVIASYLEGDTAELYAVNPNTLQSAKLGDFGEDVWPVVSLYQYDRVTDLTMTISNTSLSLYEGDTYELSVKVKGVSNTAVTWSSSDSEVASVNDNGLVTALKEGTATITATSVDVDSSGNHGTVTCEVTVKGTVTLPETITIGAQLDTGNGTDFVSINMSNLTTTTLGSSSVSFDGSGYGVGYIYGSDGGYSSTGHIYQVDPSNNYTVTTGSSCSTSYQILDVSNSPLLSNNFGYPIYIAKAQHVCLLTDYVAGNLTVWSLSSYYSDLAAISYIGTDSYSSYGLSHYYYMLCASGDMIIAATYPSGTGYGMARGSVGNIGISFSDYTALSMTYIYDEASGTEGFVVSDSSDGAALYWVTFDESDNLTAAKIGNLEGAAGISGLYSDYDKVEEVTDSSFIARGKAILAGSAVEEMSVAVNTNVNAFDFRAGTEEISSSVVSCSMSLDEILAIAEESARIAAAAEEAAKVETEETEIEEPEEIETEVEETEEVETDVAEPEEIESEIEEPEVIEPEIEEPEETETEEPEIEEGGENETEETEEPATEETLPEEPAPEDGEEGADSVVVTGSLNQVSGSAFVRSLVRSAETQSTETEVDHGTVKLTVTEDMDVTNGLIKINYDPSVLTYSSTETAIVYYALTNDAEKGVLSFDYATVKPVAAGDAIAIFNFTYEGGYINTEIKVETEERNNEPEIPEEPVDVPVDFDDHSDNVHYEYKAPTCTEEGNIEYWYCNSCGRYFADEDCTEEIDEEDTVIPATGHSWGEPKFNWTEDYRVCTVVFVCLNDDTHVETLEAEVSSAVTDATCIEDGKIVYTAVVTFEGEAYSDTQTVVIPATGHNYGDPAFVWADDYSSCVAVFVCANDESHVETVSCVVTSETTPATCNEDGAIVYTATAEFEGVVYTDSVTVAISATGHSYGEPEYSWYVDEHGETVCMATFTCIYGDDTQIVKADVTSETTEPTCTEDGETVYTAVVTFEGSEYVATKTVVLPAIGHDWSEPEFDWTEDYSACTVAFVCLNDGTHVETLEAEVSSATTEATCTEDGETVYTAVVTFEGEAYSDTQTVVIPATGHNYGEPEFIWSEDYDVCTVSFTCEVCGEIMTLTAEVTFERTEATCTEDGEIVYTATVEFEGVTYTDEVTVVIEATGHNYGEPEYVWSEDYSECTLVFTCVEGDDTQLVAGTVTVVTTEPTETEDGSIVYTVTAVFNGKTYTSTVTVVLPATGGSDEPTPSPEPTESPSPTDTPTPTPGDGGSSGSPSTGDSTNMVLWIFLCCIGVLGCVCAVIMRRKRGE